MLVRLCVAVALGASLRIPAPCRTPRPPSCLSAAARFCVVGRPRPRLRQSETDKKVVVAAAENKRKSEAREEDDNGNDEDRGEVDINVELEPVDVKKLALPLHSMETIPPDIIANIVAKDKTIVFAPYRKQSDVERRLKRMKYRYSIQSLGKVLHLRFFSVRDDTKANKAPRDITSEEFQKIKDKLRTYTRFIVVDERWPLEISLEVTPIIKHSTSSEIRCEKDVARMLSRVIANEHRVGAWCGISSTPVLAKMACEEGRKHHVLGPKDIASGGIVSVKHYDLPTHESLKEFVANIPIADVPVLGQPQIQLLKNVYGIKTCGDIAAQEDRLGFSLSPMTMDFFLSIAYGVMRVDGEIGTTLLRKGARCKSAQVRRESQFGRVVSDEQFINTVLGVFEAVYKDLLLHDFVTGRVSIDLRRHTPRIFWVTEEYEDVSPRTNNREILRDVVLRLAKRFAPRRTKEAMDAYIISVHLSDIRTWAEEFEGGTIGHGRTRRGPTGKRLVPVSPEEKKKKMKIKSPLGQKNNNTKPRGIMILM